MVHSISYRTTLCLCAMLLCFKAAAQSYVTYNHDATKMNQITVQEIGVGGLTPAFYYTLFHNSYQKSAASKNKLNAEKGFSFERESDKCREACK